MITKYIFISLITCLMILSLSIVSAQTLVAGKVYDSNYGINIADAELTINCRLTYLLTRSSNDGTYAVRFGDSECALGDEIVVAAQKGELVSYGKGTVIEGEGGENVAVVNAVMVTRPKDDPLPDERGPKGKLYFCGNGICDEGETFETCSYDCEEVIEVNTTILQSIGTNNNGNKTGNPIFLGITGAASGWIVYIGVIESIAFLVFLIVLLIGMLIIRKSHK